MLLGAPRVVETTPLGGCFHRFGDNRQLRLPALTTIRLDRFGDVCLRHALEISCALLEGSAQFVFPAGSLATAWEIPRLFSERQPFIQFGHEPAQRNHYGDRLLIASSGLHAYCLGLAGREARH